MEQLVLYLVAVGAERHDIGVLGLCAMSSHIHLVIHDRAGRYPAFLQWLHSLLARGLNQLRGRYGPVFDRRQPGVVELADPELILEHLAYVAANPTAAGLVAHGRDYAGARTNPQHFVAGPRTIGRPATQFFEASSLPQTATFRVEVPPGFDDFEPGRFAGRLAERIGALEARHRDKRRQQGKGFLGPAGQKKLRWQDTPKSKLRRGRGTIRPRVAASTRETRVAVLHRLCEFVRAHAEALDALRRGSGAAVFPHGTWAAVTRYGARCAVPP